VSVDLADYEPDWGDQRPRDGLNGAAWTGPRAEGPPAIADLPWWLTAPAFAAQAASPTPPMLVDGLVPGEGIVLLHGDPRSFKSLVAIDVALSLAAGAPALSALKVGAPRPVLYVSGEDSPRLVAERLARLAASKGLAALPDRLRLSVRQGCWLDDTTWQARLVETVRADAIGLLILDPLRSVTGAVDAGPRELQPFAKFLRLLMQASGCTILLVHHDTKPAANQPETRKRAHRASGGGLFSVSDAPIHAERVGDEDLVQLHPSSWKAQREPAPLEVRLHEDGDSLSLVATTTTSADAADRAIQLRVLDYLRASPDRSGNQIAQGIHAQRSRVSKALGDLATAGEVDSRSGLRNAELWFLRSGATVSVESAPVGGEWREG